MASRVLSAGRVPQTNSEHNEYAQTPAPCVINDSFDKSLNERGERVSTCYTDYSKGDDFLPREEPKLSLYSFDENPIAFAIERRVDGVFKVEANSRVSAEFGLGEPERFAKEHEGIPVRSSTGNHACAPPLNDNAEEKKEKPNLLASLARIDFASAFHLVMVVAAFTTIIREDPTKILNHIGATLTHM
mmetsp:Transcript_11646/g.12796  ORF Transcript_11646/g.12796 Transcript_11646/m.12796 type:complete len:188 (-) Transcript_11646:197-760(-)|eukprot:CAMPEP_0168525718 /NCGR_PEP_ID=MMETSP0405-20121227/11483_1 /TAXON_ID=498012 /ORGANISM="Trichosphaerium sp, Strain Am-I-7 wt" /LENGTH=187 /DNA_ID=CAMNT_0008548311 /DNA_START=105 /DNA_END=668 /DNA_ORIENTATION=+